jgi:hypothetical protein
MGIRVVAVDTGSAGPSSKFAWAAFDAPERLAVRDWHRHRRLQQQRRLGTGQAHCRGMMHCNEPPHLSSPPPLAATIVSYWSPAIQRLLWLRRLDG